MRYKGRGVKRTRRNWGLGRDDVGKKKFTSAHAHAQGRLIGRKKGTDHGRSGVKKGWEKG